MNPLIVAAGFICGAWAILAAVALLWLELAHRDAPLDPDWADE